jgi:hypothetical protein|tara:strand:- start:21827 stop:22246 length:420 start_codon:yes stop_codon:yes gene_type:complete
MSKKKPFKETGVGKFLIEKAPSILGIVGDAILPGNVISELISGNKSLSEADKEIALQKLTIERAEIDGTTRRWVADARSGAWLAANVRPLVLIFLTISYVIGWYLHYPLDSITGLLSIVIGGYFGSRGVEKVFGNNKHK